MIFGPSLVKEVDPPAISKMGPKFPKVAERGERDPKGAEAPRGKIWPQRDRVWNQYAHRVFLSRLGREGGGECPRAEGVGGGKPPPLQPVLTRPTEGRRILRAAWRVAGTIMASKIAQVMVKCLSKSDQGVVLENDLLPRSFLECSWAPFDGFCGFRERIKNMTDREYIS